MIHFMPTILGKERYEDVAIRISSFVERIAQFVRGAGCNPPGTASICVKSDQMHSSEPVALVNRPQFDIQVAKLYLWVRREELIE